jgi:hypothetical protein
LRRRGFSKPIILASNGDFKPEDLGQALNFAISKDVPTLETIQSWCQSN